MLPIPQAFDALLRAFATYQPLLLRVREEYDKRMEEALACCYKHMHMRALLGRSERALVSVNPSACSTCIPAYRH